MADTDQSLDPNQPVLGVAPGQTPVVPDLVAAPVTPPVGDSLLTPTTPPDIVTDESFQASIPLEYQNNPALAAVPNFETLVKNYVNAQSKLGSSVSLPGEGATQEQVDEFYQKIGCPADIEGYTAHFTEQGLNTDNPDTMSIIETAKQIGVNPTQIAHLFRKVAELEGGDETQLEVEYQQNMETVTLALRDEWGAAFDNQLGIAKQVVASYPGLAEGLQRTGAGNDPQVIKAFASIGHALANGGFIDGTAVGSMSKDDAVSAATTIMQSDAYRNGQDPGHNNAVAEAARLFEIAYPGKN